MGLFSGRDAGEAVTYTGSRPGSFGGAVDRVLAEDPFVGCLASWVVWTVGTVMVILCAAAGMARLGGLVWTWEWVRNGSYAIPICLETVYRYL
jgi:hypothetical protein